MHTFNVIFVLFTLFQTWVSLHFLVLCLHIEVLDLYEGKFLFIISSSRGSCYSLLQYKPSSDPLSCIHHQRQQHNLDINVFITQF